MIEFSVKLNVTSLVTIYYFPMQYLHLRMNKSRNEAPHKKYLFNLLTASAQAN